MTRIKRTQPVPDRDKGQRSIDYAPYYIPRNPIFAFTRPSWQTTNAWREAVLRQPIALICKETLIANIVNLDWKIEPRDSEQRDELKDKIKYYERFFQYTGDYDYVEITEFVMGDMLDTPFGSGVETGRENDDPEGDVLWIELLDSAYLYPTLNANFPVGQYVPESGQEAVYFPWYAIDRVYWSPRNELKRKGWSMSPPEKIYLALEMLNKGDIYYANLLLDTPSAGILDLGDMAKDSAEEWVNSWRVMLGGIDAFKIPVLYEHNNPVNWIPFTRNPAELAFGDAMIRYASIACAGYGMNLSDIGLSGRSSGGETLAGTIRQERQTRRTGFGRATRKMKFFWDRMLPKDLEFKFINLDDELSTALGRARLASSTAFQQLIAVKSFTPKEARLQMIADGLITISIPEDVPEDEFPQPVAPQVPAVNERPSMLGRPVTPSEGGYGEVKQAELDVESDIIENNIGE